MSEVGFEGPHEVRLPIYDIMSYAQDMREQNKIQRE